MFVALLSWWMSMGIPMSAWWWTFIMQNIWCNFHLKINNGQEKWERGGWETKLWLLSNEYLHTVHFQSLKMGMYIILTTYNTIHTILAIWSIKTSLPNSAKDLKDSIFELSSTILERERDLQETIKWERKTLIRNNKRWQYTNFEMRLGNEYYI